MNQTCNVMQHMRCCPTGVISLFQRIDFISLTTFTDWLVSLPYAQEPINLSHSPSYHQAVIDTQTWLLQLMPLLQRDMNA